MALINAETGETRFDDGLHVIFTAEAFMWAEAQLKVSTMALVTKAMQLDIGFNEVVTLLHCGAEAWRRRNQPNAPKVQPQRALSCVEKHGLMNIVPELTEAIMKSGALGLASSVADEPEDDAAPFGGGLSSVVSSGPESPLSTLGD